MCTRKLSTVLCRLGILTEFYGMIIRTVIVGIINLHFMFYTSVVSFKYKY